MTAGLRDAAIKAGLIVPMLPSDPNYYQCGRKVPYVTIRDAFAVAARLSETSPEWKRICIYPCRWLHPGAYHIGHRQMKRGELEKQLIAYKGKATGYESKAARLSNELTQAREARDGWKLLTNAYRDSFKAYPIINKLLARFGLQLGTIVEKEKL